MSEVKSDVIIQELPEYAPVALRSLGKDRRLMRGPGMGMQPMGYVDQGGQAQLWSGDSAAPYVKILAGQWARGAFNAVAGAVLLAEPGRLGRIFLLNLAGTGNAFRYVHLINTSAKAFADVVLGTNAETIWRGVLPPADQISVGTLPGVYAESFLDVGGLAFDDGIAFAISTSPTTIAAGGQTCSGNVLVGGL